MADGHWLDTLGRALAASASRKEFLRAAGAAAAGLLLGDPPAAAAARNPRTCRSALDCGAEQQCVDGRCVCVSGGQACRVRGVAVCCPADAPLCCPPSTGGGCCPTAKPVCCSDRKSSVGCCPAALPVCCPSSTFGVDGCCSADRPVCCEGRGGCCRKEEPICCNAQRRCCPKNRPVCCDHGCCGKKQTCCPTAEGGCCAQGATCCPEELGGGCCPQDAPVCCGDTCCAHGESCCSTDPSGCCPPGQTCGPNGCTEKPDCERRPLGGSLRAPGAACNACCPEGRICCVDAQGVERCVDPLTDRFNCGACGIQCRRHNGDAESLCHAGSCCPSIPGATQTCAVAGDPRYRFCCHPGTECCSGIKLDGRPATDCCDVAAGETCCHAPLVHGCCPSTHPICVVSADGRGGCCAVGTTPCLGPSVVSCCSQGTICASDGSCRAPSPSADADQPLHRPPVPVRSSHPS